MINVAVKGGLGNQMFQYAFGRSLSEYYGENLVLDVSSFETDTKRSFALNKYVLNPNIEVSSSLVNKLLATKMIRAALTTQKKVLGFNAFVYLENNSFEFDKGTYSTRLRRFNGYWQSYKYFDDIKKDLIKEFNFNYDKSGDASGILNQIINNNSVGVHVRRGDYRTCSSASDKHGCLPVTYFINAIQYMNGVMDRPIFYVFSDEIEIVKEEFKDLNAKIEYVSVISDDSDICELFLMSRCKGNIISNSSYSWWAAYLNRNDTVVCPKKWFRENEITTCDLFPEKWKQL